MKTSSDRLRYIDIAKGLAMICIILGHLGIPEINRVVYTFHVPIFYFITGFFVSDRRSVADFTKNKSRTLLVPYFVTCGVMVLIGIIIGYTDGDAAAAAKKWVFAALYGAGDSYTEPFYIPGIGAIWFLWATFFGSIFLRISLNMNKAVRIGFIIGLFVFGYFSREIFWFPLSIQAGACAAFFMYLGYLLKGAKEHLSNIPAEIKVIAAIIGAFVWIEFMADFKSFWLVHNDIGRGVIDIVGCICACAIVMLISWFIDRKTGFFAGILSFFGKYSLFILCVHIVELRFFPWKQITGALIAHGMPQGMEMVIIIAGKLAMDLLLTLLLSKIPAVRKLYGMKG